MDQPLDGQSETANRRADGIDQKRHVVVDDRKAEMPVILRNTDAFQQQAGFASLALLGAQQGISCGFFAGFLVKAGIFTR